MRHKHRIVPGHAGGKYTEGNCVYVSPATCDGDTASHAMWHWANYFLYGNPYDKIAARGLAGYLGKEDTVREKCSLSGKKNGKTNARLMLAHPNTLANQKVRGRDLNTHPNTIAQRPVNGRSSMAAMPRELKADGGRKGGKMNGAVNGKKSAKPVVCLEDGVIYSSAHEASRATGVRQPGISRSCRKGCRAGGFHWQFIQQEDSNGY